MHSHVEKTYKKVSQIEHILLRPDTYIGSIREAEEMMWVVEGEEFMQKKIKYVPGLYKIFDEILVNAADNYQRDKKMTRIQVHINRQQVSVMNDGKGIPVQIHKTHKIYVPELIFGNLLTSSNYEDKQKKVVGGRNGYGAKLANLFSTHFEIEAADSLNKKLYKQSWKNNMTVKEQAVIESFSGSDYTKVTYRPDFSRFDVSKFSPDMINLMKRRVYDISGILKVNVYLNGKMVQVPNFKEYSKMHMENPNQTLAQIKDKHGRWHVLACRSEGQFTQVSFVNGISTAKGGSHVTYVLDQIVGKIMEAVVKKKITQVKPFQIKAHLSLFVNCLIENPCFNSQIKEMLTTSASDFGSQCIINDEFIKQLLKTGIVQRVIHDVKAKEHNKIQRQLKKAKKNRLIIPKLEDANEAGRSNSCCLILTEGDSAKALALCGLQTLGRDLYGVFPLRGKPANVKSMTPKMVMDNAQLSSIVKIMGLAFGKEYNSTTSLRYSSVMIMADQDIDGSHIKGLVINFFETFWPSLCKIDGFLKQFITPIIKCRKGENSINFYSLVEYNKWESQNRDSGWSIKYYKGLGTSTAKEAKQYFSALQIHEIKFSCRSQKDHNALELAFEKKNANLRKQWLGEYNPQSGLDHRIKRVTIEDFVNKELIHFSNEDNARSIPSLMDGLKPSQRKILFACFKRNLTKQIKVAQLAGYVAEHSAYHHGQMSLCGAIISMAQNFVGSNNLNLLQPLGQFGTRYERGKDYASSRYIFTKLNPLTRYIFKQEDDHIVDYQHEENQNIEPNYYLPILPMILINGTEGIGTGWSTNIQPHKVEDVIALMKDRLNGKERDISIGWEGFKGQVERTDRGSFVVKGVYQTNDQTVTITQIPVSKGIRQYKAFLEEKLPSQENQDADIQDLKQYHHDSSIEFVIRFITEKMPDDSEMQKYLKLVSNYQLNNMHLFNQAKRIVKYESVQQIVNEFYQERIKGYYKRKRYLISKFKKERDLLDNQIRFIQEVMDGRFKMVQSKGQWVNMLRNRGYTRFQELNKILSTQNKEQDDNEKNSDFNFLLTMPIWSFCTEKIKDMTSVREELNTITEYYEKITQGQMWLQDIEAFEEAWIASNEGKIVKTSNNRKNQIASQVPSRKRRSVVNDQVSEEQVVTEKKTNRRRRNMMEEQIDNVTQQKSGRKKPKKDETNVLQEIKPLNLVVPEKSEEKKSVIDSILQKYLCESSSKGGELSLIDRIKARLENGEPSFKSSYDEAKKQLQSSKKKVEEDNKMQIQDDDELLKKYLI